MTELRRVLGLRDLVLFNIAAVVGIRWLAAAAQAGPGSLVLWIAAALLFFVPSALAVATLSSLHPDEGGIYVWTKQYYGEWNGFLCGWCYWLSNLFYFPNLLLAGLSMAGSAFGVADSKPFLIAASLALLWVALLTHLFGLTVGKWTNNLGAVCTYAAGALILALGFAVWLRTGSATPMRWTPDWSLDKLNFWSQIAFAFGGLELGAVMGGEIRDPRRNVPRAAWIAGIGIAAFYILGTLAMLAVLQPNEISILSGLVQTGHAAGARLGLPSLGWILAVLVIVGVTGQLGAWIGGCARLPLVIGMDRYLPKAFTRIHPRWHSPHVAILTQGAVCTLFVIALQAGENIRVGYQLLVDMTVITYFVPFLYLFGAAWKCGRRASGASGATVTAIAIALSLVPPQGTASVWWFEAKLAGGCAVLVALAAMLFYGSSKRKANR